MAVQISGNDITVPRDGTFTRNVTIGGTLTYEDVTNIDSVGLVTARSGIEIGARPGVAASISVDGNAIFSGITTVGSKIDVTNDTHGNLNAVLARGDDTAFQLQTRNDTHGNDPQSGIGTFGVFRNDNDIVGLKFMRGTGAAGAGSLGITQAGVEKIRVGAGGSVGIGTNVPDTILHLYGSSGNQKLITLGGGSSKRNNYIGITGSDNLEIGVDEDNEGSGSTLRFRIDGGEKARITSGGLLLVGHDSAKSGKIQAFTGSQDAIDICGYNSNATHSGRLTFYRSKNATVGSNTEVADGDSLGRIDFRGYNDDGTAYNIGATIEASVDGAVDSTTDMPSALLLKTSADGSASPTERLRIDSNGHVTKPYQFHIEVDRDSDQTGYNASANFGTPMIFNRVIRTIGTENSALDTSTGKITVPVAGVYFLEATAYSTTAALQQGWFTEGTSRMNYSDHAYDSKTNRIQTVGMHYLPANTEVGYKPYGSGETNVTIGDSVYHTWFRVTLIG